MKKFTFAVSVVADSLDSEVVEQTIRESLVDALPGDTAIGVKAGAVKEFSVQGFKVYRARVLRVTAEMAGDSANPKKKPKVQAQADIAAALAAANAE